MDYVFVAYKKDSSLLGGTFIKKRDLSPLKFSRVKSFLRSIIFTKDEELGEPSHLIWDMKNNVIISEMNWAGARHISLKFDKYLKEILKRDIRINVIFHEEAQKILFLKKKILKRISLTVAKPHVNLIHDTVGADVKEMEKYVNDGKDLGIEMTIMCKKKNKGLIKEKIINLYEKIKSLKNKKDIKLLVKDKDTILDLLEGAFIKEKMEFEIDDETKSIKEEDFFNKTKKFWEDKKEDVLKIIQK